jgi:sugar/nucleoside kinase (ribokinase family)
MRTVHVPQRDIEILDRVGGGDSFASGLIYGFLAGNTVEWAVRWRSNPSLNPQRHDALSMHLFCWRAAGRT